MVGGRQELAARAVEGWETFEGHSPHRPWVDAVRIACPKCGRATSRIPDVGNPWLDAGIVPYSTMGYASDRRYWEKWFPADWISESFPGQFRNWFYAILAMSTAMENRPPFKLMFGYRLMKDERGQEMHKSKGNSIEFYQAAEQEGADAMRWLYASHNPENDLWFGYNKIRDGRRQFLTLWNVFEFFQTYAPLDGFNPATTATVPLNERPDLDRWILARLDRLRESGARNYERFAVHIFMRDVVTFIDALSRWYLRRSRRRFWKASDDVGKLAGYQTLWECLVTVVKLLAPVTPFVTEHMYQKLVCAFDEKAPESVHHCDFPLARGVDEQGELLLSAMDAVLELVEVGLAARQKAGLKIRQPVGQLRVVTTSTTSVSDLEAFTALVCDELNVKILSFVDSVADLYTVSARLNGATVKPRLGRRFGLVAKVFERLTPAEIEAGTSREGRLTIDLPGERIELEPSDVVTEKIGVDGWVIAEGHGFVAALDTALTEDLLREGRVRDLVRGLQILRKQLGFEVGDRIRIRYAATGELAAAIAANAAYLAEETLAVALEPAESVAGKTVEVGAEAVTFELTRA